MQNENKVARHTHKKTAWVIVNWLSFVKANELTTKLDENLLS